MSGHVDDALGVLRDWSRYLPPEHLDAVDVLAGELERLRAHWQEVEHPFDKSEYDAMYEREQTAVASRDALAVQVEQLKAWQKAYAQGRSGLVGQADQDFARAEAAEAQVEQLIEALEEYDRWASRMPDAGFNDQSPRWNWWYERPYTLARAALDAGSTTP